LLQYMGDFRFSARKDYLGRVPTPWPDKIWGELRSISRGGFDHLKWALKGLGSARIVGCPKLQGVKA
jgi:hypothetical protein